MASALCYSAVAAILPAERTVDWSRAGVQPTLAAAEGVSTKVGSNIPHRNVIGANVMDFGAVANDSTDNSKAFAAAIAATPAGKVCYIPAGVYRTSGGLDMKSGVTVRGAGPGLTIIKMTATWSGPNFGLLNGGMQSNYENYSGSIASGGTAGSTSIRLTDAAAVASYLGPILPGEHLVVTEMDDPSFVSATSFNGTFTSNSWAGVKRNRGQIINVASVSGNTITFTPALFSSFTNAPLVTRFLKKPLSGAGLEDVTLYATAATLPEINVQFINAQNCWMYNVRSDFASQNHVRMTFSMWCELRKCHFVEAFYHTSGSDNEVSIAQRSTANLVIDNIVERLHLGILVDKAAAGNVIAYNYVFGEYDDSEASGNRSLQMGISGGHGAHGQFNLFEGNVAQKFVADAFWGTSSHNTLLRNWFKGNGTSHGPYSTRSGSPGPAYDMGDLRRAVDLWQGNSKYSVIGNILGDANMSNGTFKAILGRDGRQPAEKYIWQLDYYNNYNNNVPAEYVQWGPRASTTLIDHGNYDYVNKAQTWDASIADRNIPASLFLSGKPAFFGDLAWPPFNPDSANPSPSVASIPAGFRALNNVNPPGELPLPVPVAQAPFNVQIKKLVQ